MLLGRKQIVLPGGGVALINATKVLDKGN